MSSANPAATASSSPHVASSVQPPPKTFFAPPTVPLLDASALDFYDSLPIIQDGAVLVSHISSQRGKGLISTQTAEAGDLMLAERPVLALQHSGNRRWMRACEHCLRSIGSVREQWLRLMEERRRSRVKRQRRKLADTNNGAAHDHPSDDDEDTEDDEDEEGEEGEEEQLTDDEKADAPYVLPNPLPFTSPTSSPRFNIERYDVTPVQCSECDEEYCSIECRDAAWQQYHSILCPHVSFKLHGASGGSDGSKKEEKKEPTPLDDGKLHPLQRLYKFADENNEIFRLVTKLIATVISSHTASDSTSASAPSLFPFSLYAASVWWQQVAPPADLSPVSASRFQSTLQSMCAEALTLIQAAFPTHSQPTSPFAFLFTLPMIGRLVSIFESNQLSLFAPSPVDTYIAFLLSLPPAQLDQFKQSVTPSVYRATNAVSSKRVEGVGLFTLLCCINHSCVPNCRLVKRDHEREEEGFVDLDCQMAAMATRHIADGEELTINYVEDSEPVEGGERMTWRERAVALLDYGIVCDCERCEEEKRREEDGDDGGSEDEAELQQFEDDDNDADEDDADAEDDENEDEEA